MLVNIKGRINNTHLSKGNALLPLFEAIVNSIQSIEDLTEAGECGDYYIKITANRDISNQISIKDNDINKDGSDYSIDSFEIEDNGVGFDDKNYKSFQTADSTLKSKKGGKGIGRFLWLKAFDEVEVKSIYKIDNNYFYRNFNFLLNEDDPIKLIGEGISNKNECLTKIKLLNFKQPYKDSCPKKLETIAIKIIEHCIQYFVLKNCPKIFISDGFDTINLNNIFNSKIAANIEKVPFLIKEHKFNIIHVKLFSSEENQNLLHYCANQREVYYKNLNKYIPNLSGKIKINDEKPFVYAAFLSSELFDKNVNAERTDFILSKDEETLIDDVSMEEITNQAIIHIKDYLKKYLEPINAEKVKKIKEYINTKSPQYKPIIKYGKEKVEDIVPNISENNLEIELYKISQQLNYEAKKQGEEILNKKAEDIKDADQYKKEYNEFVEKTNDLGKSTLAQYIIHRKVMLDLLKSGLSMRQNSKYQLEDYIHNLIFPMKKLSDDIDYEKHNLWIIDEKLSYHYYLASDIALNQQEPIKVNSDDRPDLLIIDNPIVVVNEDTVPYNSIVIIEFKRPMRNDYTDEKNPVDQVLNYAREIRDGNKSDKNGRLISVNPDTPFYLYIICDLSKKLRKVVENYGWTKTPDNCGYFGYNQNLNAYIEIISYDKMLQDSLKRNKILFNKLFCPEIK